MNTSATHYEILEIAESASDEVVKAAYRSLSQKWHPDKNPTNRAEAERRIRLINQAYTVLSNPSHRRLYDEQLTAQRQGDVRNDEAVGNKRSSGLNSQSQSLARQVWLGLLCGASVVMVLGVLPYELATGRIGWEGSLGVLFWGAVGHYGYRGLRYPEEDRRRQEAARPWRRWVARARRKAIATALVACAASTFLIGAGLVLSGDPIRRAMTVAFEIAILVAGLAYIISALVQRAAMRS